MKLFTYSLEIKISAFCFLTLIQQCNLFLKKYCEISIDWNKYDTHYKTYYEISIYTFLKFLFDIFYH